MTILNEAYQVLLQLVMNHWADLLLVLVFVGVLCWLWKRGKKELLYRMVYDLVVQAEKYLGSGTGELKYNLVISAVYGKLPLVLRALFTKKEIDNMIYSCVEQLKKFLRSGGDLEGYHRKIDIKIKE